MRLPDGSARWLDAGEHTVEPLDRVTGLIDGVQIEGTVFVAPEQLLQPPAALDGIVLSATPPAFPDPDCTALPGADLPPLGTVWSKDGVTGLVIQIDPVCRTVTVQDTNGKQAEVSLPEANET